MNLINLKWTKRQIATRKAAASEGVRFFSPELLAFLLVIFFANFASIQYSSAQDMNSNSLKPNLPKASKGVDCVEPVEIMRRNHMLYLQHQRDDTLRKGIRGARYSLGKCIECHASADASSNNEMTIAPFCGECHKYAAVAPDCFSCHSPKLDKSSNNNLTSKPNINPNLKGSPDFQISQSFPLDHRLNTELKSYLDKGDVQ